TRADMLYRSANDDEVGGHEGVIRARDVRAADLQEEPTKRIESRLGCPRRSFRRMRRRRRLPSEHRSERSEPSDTASERERSNQTRDHAPARASTPEAASISPRKSP